MSKPRSDRSKRKSVPVSARTEVETVREHPAKTHTEPLSSATTPGATELPDGGTGVHLQGFNILRQFEARGGEADIFLVKTGDDEGILKLYRFGINPKMEIVQAMLALSREHPKQFVQIQFFGYHPETRRFFELQEYIREGSLVEYLARTSEGVEENIILAFLRQTCEILSILHANNILHLDLKPGNILLRHADPLEIVLTDFGIASILQEDFSKKMTEVKGTSLFQSPESIAGVVGRPSDWWSLGMIILEMLTGKNPFESLNRQVVFFHLTTQAVPIPNHVNSRWRNLLQGLLTRNPEKRWSEKEVQRWISGEEVPVYNEEPSVSTDDASESGDSENKTSVFQFLGKPYRRLDALLEAFISSPDAWRQAKVQVNKGYLVKWLEEIRDYERAGRIGEMAAGRDDPDIILFRIIFSLRKDLPFSIQGELVTQERINRCFGAALNNDTQSSPERGAADRAFLKLVFENDLPRMFIELTGYRTVPCERILHLAAETRSTSLSSVPLKDRIMAVIMASDETLKNQKSMDALTQALRGVPESIAVMNVANLPGFVDFALKIGLFSYRDTISWRFACHLYDRQGVISPAIFSIIQEHAEAMSSAVQADGSIEEVVLQLLGKEPLQEETIKTVQTLRMNHSWLLEIIRSNFAIGQHQDVGKFLEMNLMHFRAREKKDSFAKLVLPPFMRDLLQHPMVSSSYSFLIRKMVETPGLLPERGKYRLVDESGRAFPVQEWSDIELGLKAEGFHHLEFGTIESFQMLKEYLELRRLIMMAGPADYFKGYGSDRIPGFFAFGVLMGFFVSWYWLIVFGAMAARDYVNFLQKNGGKPLANYEEEAKKVKARFLEEVAKPRRRFRD